MAEGFSDWASEFFWETPSSFWGKMWGDYMKLWRGAEGEDIGTTEPERRPAVPQPEHQSPYGVDLPIMERYEEGMEKRRDLWDYYEKQMGRGGLQKPEKSWRNFWESQGDKRGKLEEIDKW